MNLCLSTRQILAASLTVCHKNSSSEGAPLSLKVFVAGRNRLENDGATALAQAFQVQSDLGKHSTLRRGIPHCHTFIQNKACSVGPDPSPGPLTSGVFRSRDLHYCSTSLSNIIIVGDFTPACVLAAVCEINVKY